MVYFSIWLKAAAVRCYAEARRQDRYGLEGAQPVCLPHLRVFSGGIAGGAQQVVNVDMSHGAMAIGQQNHQLNGITTGASFLAHDIFYSWARSPAAALYSGYRGTCPATKKGSFGFTNRPPCAAPPDLLSVPRRLAVLLCSNAPELATFAASDAELAPEL